MNLHEAGRLTEDEARAYLEGIRWPNGPACPHCGVVESQYRLRGKAHRAGVWKCGTCREQYTVTVGTIMHRSHIPLSKWVMAFHLMCAAKKGLSGLQLQRHLGFGSYRTAWHMAHRIRLAMREEPLASLLRGVVEVDETFVGGKPRYRQLKPGRKPGDWRAHHKGPAADFADRKTPVVALVERGGPVRARVVTDVGSYNLRSTMRDHVDPSAKIMTDERPAYRTLARLFGGHEAVKHLRHEYVRGEAHINTAESFFALLKRGVVGQWHNVSRKHLARYVDEVAFRWNVRAMETPERMEAAIRGGDGKRLTYRPISA